MRRWPRHLRWLAAPLALAPLAFGAVAPAAHGPRASDSPPAAGVLAVGGSVMLAAAAQLRRRTRATVDAGAGRSNAQIIDRLWADRAGQSLPPAVVVQLGERSPLTAGQLARLRVALRGVPYVVLVSVREGNRGWQGQVNRALRATVRSWPAASIADWYAASADAGLLTHGLDPDPAGTAVYASVVMRALQTAIAATQTTIVSDSVAAGVQESPQAALALTLGLRVRLELAVCRRLVARSCPYQGVAPPTALATVTALGSSLGQVLVVDVGYNDVSAGYGAGIDRLMRAATAQGAQEVIWVTLRQAGVYASTYAQTDAAITGAARRWPALRVADWNQYSRGEPWFADGLHLNAAGALALAEFLRGYITGGAR
jgi:hypothetical protein